MDFGKALSHLKKGEKVARKGWNGKGQYIELGMGFSYVDPNGNAVNAKHEAIGGMAIVFHGTSGVQVGWLASQADMLAEDWFVVEKDAKKTEDDKPTEQISKTVVHVDKDKGIVSIVGNDPEGICEAMDAIAEMLGVDE